MVARHSTPFDFVFLQNLGGQSQVKNLCIWGHQFHLADVGVPRAMSAFEGKADIAFCTAHVCF